MRVEKGKYRGEIGRGRWGDTARKRQRGGG
jgi:hypothetical protein